MMLKPLLLGTALAAGACGLYAVAEPPPITGYPSITDGDTIRFGSARIRLWGIDAPEMAQRCGDPSWACGVVAREKLIQLTAGHEVSCYPRDTDRYKRTVARCYVNGADIGASMVATGNAVDYRQYSGGAYADQEAAAQKERMGIWSGPFINPAQWRHSHAR